MTAEEIAVKLADLFRNSGWPYPAEPEIDMRPPYPLVVIWDDLRELTVLIACTTNRFDYNAKEFAETIAIVYEIDGRAPTGAVGYMAHPAATDPQSIMIPEFIVPKEWQP